MTIAAESPDTDTEATDVETLPPQSGPPAKRRRRKTGYWMRVFHVYSSVAGLLIILFFAVTGLTLNHPGWTFGFDGTSTTHVGTLPPSFATPSGVDFLVVSEHMRNEHGVRGVVDDHRADEREGTITFRGPGYSAGVRFDLATGSYELNVDAQGLVGVMNDVHKGRHTNSVWAKVIDVTALLLIVVAVTGLGIQVFTAKRRRLALSIAAVGSVLTVVAILATLA